MVENETQVKGDPGPDPGPDPPDPLTRAVLRMAARADGAGDLPVLVDPVELRHWAALLHTAQKDLGLSRARRRDLEDLLRETSLQMENLTRDLRHLSACMEGRARTIREELKRV